MSALLPGISQADWLATPARFRENVGKALLLRQEYAHLRPKNDQIQQQLTALAMAPIPQSFFRSLQKNHLAGRVFSRAELISC